MDLNISPLIPAVIDNFPFLNPGKLGKQLHDGSSRHTLAAAGLSYNAECLAAFNVHGNTIDRPVAALIRIEIRLEIFNRNYYIIAHILPPSPAVSDLWYL